MRCRHLKSLWLNFRTATRFATNTKEQQSQGRWRQAQANLPTDSDRVAKLLKSRGDYLRAFLVLSETDKAAAKEIARNALFEAQRLGDLTSQLRILDGVLEDARLGSDSRDLMSLILSKAQALQHTGRAQELDSVFAEAEALAAESEDPILRMRAREARATYLASITLIPENLELLQKLEQDISRKRRSVVRWTPDHRTKCPAYKHKAVCGKCSGFRARIRVFGELERRIWNFRLFSKYGKCTR